MRLLTCLLAAGTLALLPAGAQAKAVPVPIASCVVRAPGAVPVAVFATKLPGRHSVRVPRGIANRITGGHVLGTQRTVFRAGRHAALRVRFHRPARTVTWLLGGRTASAGRRTPSCRLPQSGTQTGNTQPQPPSELAVSTTPGLQPSFSPAVSDYVTRCDGTSPITVTVDASADTPVSVDGHPAQSGSFQVPVPLTNGQEFAFTAGGTVYHVRCLPNDFPPFFAVRTGPTQAEFHFLGLGHYAIVFDDQGVPIWWYQSDAVPLDTELLPDGNIAFARSYGGPFATDPRAGWDVRGLDGQLVRTVSAVGPAPADAHELRVLPDGNYLLLSYVPRSHVDLSAYGRESDATVYDAEIQEVTPAGQLVWSWNSKDHLSFGESSPRFLTQSPYDYVHMNALQESADGNILFSARNMDAVFKIDRATGDVIWKLGGTTTPQSLAVIGDRNTQVFGGQHDIRELADGTITVHDNRTAISGQTRAVRFRIDDAARTATLLEQVTDPDAPTSVCCGSARRMAGGDWVIQWGSHTLVTEQTPDATPRTQSSMRGKGTNAWRGQVLDLGPSAGE